MHCSRPAGVMSGGSFFFIIVQENQVSGETTVARGVFDSYAADHGSGQQTRWENRGIGDEKNFFFYERVGFIF